jgi:hypothetical protein
MTCRLVLCSVVQILKCKYHKMPIRDLHFKFLMLIFLKTYSVRIESESPIQTSMKLEPPIQTSNTQRSMESNLKRFG